MSVVLAAIVAVALAGCATEDPLAPTGTKPPAPTGNMVQSVNETSVRLKWTIPSITADVTGYELMAIEVVTAGTPTERLVPVSGAGATSGVIDGLIEGKIYKFMVHAMNKTVRSDASNEVVWAPARRGTGTYKLYSALNTTNGSGLGIFNQAAGPSVLKIADGGKWDICFDDRQAPSDPRISSPGQSDYVNGATVKFPNGDDARIIYWGKQYAGITSLDDIYETDALSVPASGGEKFYSINSIGGTANWGSVIAWKDESTTPASFWYAKVVMSRTGSNFVQGTGASSFIEVSISYQNVKNLPYAVKQRIENFIQVEQARRSTPVK